MSLCAKKNYIEEELERQQRNFQTIALRLFMLIYMYANSLP